MSNAASISAVVYADCPAKDKVVKNSMIKNGIILFIIFLTSFLWCVIYHLNDREFALLDKIGG